MERYIGRSLNEVLGKEGEEAYHRCEAEIISYYMSEEHIVVILEEAVIAQKRIENYYHQNLLSI